MYPGPTNRNSGVICDQCVVINDFYSVKNDHRERSAPPLLTEVDEHLCGQVVTFNADFDFG